MLTEKRFVNLCVALAAALAFVAVKAPAFAATPDAVVTAKVKLALLTTEGVHVTAVNVDTVNGQVTLHGKVDTAAEKSKAEDVAKTINGATTVRNLLQVVPEQRADQVQASDDDIKKNVEAKLKSSKALEDSSIAVQSVNNGVVLLGGNAKALTDHLDAVLIASSVPGVRHVASEVKSSDSLGDAEIWKNSKEEAGKAKGTISDTARDAYVTSATKLRLLADSKTPALQINVDTRSGVVTLFGMVPTQEAKSFAENDARQVSGVKSVKNELQVVPTANQETVKAKDDVLLRELKKSLADNQDLKGIDVEVKNCVARLSGTVPSSTDRLKAAVLARSTSGVCSVQDDLKVSD